MCKLRMSEYTDTLFDTLHDWVDTLQINESR